MGGRARVGEAAVLHARRPARRDGAVVAAASLDEQLALAARASGPWRRGASDVRRVGPRTSWRRARRADRDELERLRELNAAYRDKFGFPFLYAVKGSTKHDILNALERRLPSPRDMEHQEALRQVFRIARFRLEDIDLVNRFARAPSATTTAKATSSPIGSTATAGAGGRQPGVRRQRAAAPVRRRILENLHRRGQQRPHRHRFDEEFHPARDDEF